MADGYFTDAGVYTSTSLPTPSDTPYRTPSFSRSRRTSGRGTPGSASSATPPLLHPEDAPDNGEELSPLDPRRFTPTLQASLVSEILSLRRDIESKNGFIDKLEANFSTVKNENETLSAKLADKERDIRSAKKQLQGLEDGTLSVIEELCKERDEANKTNAELKKRYETTLKKLKTEEESAERNQSSRDKEKQQWADEKRSLERKVYLADGRLKSLLEELQAREALADGELTKDSGLGDESETGSIRSLKTGATRHARHRSSSLNELRDSYLSAAGLTGVSLADELKADDGEDDDAAQPENSYNKNTSIHRRLDSTQSSKYQDDEPAGALHKLTGAQEPPNGIVEPSTSEAVGPYVSKTETRRELPASKSAYVDTGVQFTPPASPTLMPQASSLSQDESDLGPIGKAGDEVDGEKAPSDTARSAMDLAMARQSWGDSILPPTPTETIKEIADDESVASNASSMPKGFEDSEKIIPPQPDQPPPPPPPGRAPPPAPVIIPSIAIHPPADSPSSPTEPVLPPSYKSVGSQTEVSTAPDTRSFGMQTEFIRMDKRLLKLPIHLQPSTVLASLPLSPMTDRLGLRAGKDLSPVPEDSPERGSRRERRQTLPRDASPTPPPSAGLTYDDVFSENDVDDLVSEGMRYPRLGKPFKPYTRSTGTNVFDYDYFDELGELDLSDTEYDSYMSTAKNARRMQKQNRAFRDMPPSVPEDEMVGFRSSYHRSRNSNGSRSSFDRSTVKSSKSFAYTHPTRPTDNRRALLTQKTGTTEHQLSRSPSFGSLASSSNFSKTSGPAPPFAIPIRRSSVGITIESASPTGRRGTKKTARQTPKEKPVLRKSFSTSSLKDDAESSRKPSREYNFTTTPGSAGVPPLPKLDLSQYQQSREIQSRGSRFQQYTAVTPTGNASVGASLQHSVVDAIAATMIGEWMWKYVRKRTTFGVSEANQDFAKNGDSRHKRWAWLSPYERTVMWSSKQPTSNAALMGKNGRKYVVQSVLDIKDDSPRPKGISDDEVFERSILILTPSRALKFTATSREKHFLWLTALSFLAHNTSTIPDLAFLPTPYPPPGNASTSAPSEHSNRSSANTSGRQSRAPSIKRGGAIRDSLRIARDRTNPIRPQSATNPQTNAILIPASGYTSPVPPVPSTSRGTANPTSFAFNPASVSEACDPPNIPRIHGAKGETVNPILTMHNKSSPATMSSSKTVPKQSSRPRLRRRSNTGPKAKSSSTTANGEPSVKSHNNSSQSSKFSTANPTASNSTADVNRAGVRLVIPPTAPAAKAPSLPSPIAPSERSSSLGIEMPPPLPIAATNGSLLTAGGRDAETQPRASDISADFGSNFNFFDAVKNGVTGSLGAMGGSKTKLNSGGPVPAVSAVGAGGR